MSRTAMLAAAVPVLLAALGGCSRQAEPAAQARPAAVAAAVQPAGPGAALTEGIKLDEARVHALMTAIYGAAYDRGKGQAHAPMENNKSYGYSLLSYVSAQALPGNRTAVVVNGAPADEQGNDLTSHAAGGVLNVYILRGEGAALEVLERHERIKELGSTGNIGPVEWTELGPGKPGFVVMSGGMWQGHSISHAEVFALDGGVRYLGGFPLHSGNTGACVPETGECWEVDGAIRVAAGAPSAQYPDLNVAFRDKRFTVSEPAKPGADMIERVSRDARTTVVYRFDGKAYAPLSGTNPVPSI